MTDAAVRSVYRAIWNSDYDEDVDLKGRTAAHALAEQMAGALAKDGLLAAPRTQSHRARHDVYVRLSNEAVAETRGPWDGVNVDLDKDEQVVGVEVLAAQEVDIDGHPVAAPQPPGISGPEHARLCQEAKKLGLAEAYLERRGETTWIRAARVIRAVHNRLPGRAPIGLREAKVLGEAIAVAFEEASDATAS